MIIFYSKIFSGIYTWANGDEYQGQWKNNNRNGYGRLLFNNGDIYEGMFEFKDDTSFIYGCGYLMLKNQTLHTGGSSDFKFPLILSEDRSKLIINSADILDAWSDPISKTKNVIKSTLNESVIIYV